MAKLLTIKEIDTIFSVLAKENPEPVTELTSVNEYTLLVAIILSAQATDVGVNKATPALFKAADNPASMIKLGEDGVRQHIKTIGLFNSKAKNVIKMSHMLLDDFDGKIPETREDLQKLPGVGRKTASVWLNCARGMPFIAVDTHVFRVSNRLGICQTKNPDQTEAKLEKRIPSQWRLHAHHWLILHGRYTCVARKPKCEGCIIRELCNFKGKVV